VLSKGAEPDRVGLVDLLHEGIAAGKPWSLLPGRSWLRPAHRVDTEASGVLLLAKNKAALTALEAFFGSATPARFYAVIVQGRPTEDRLELTSPIGPHPTKPGQFRIDPDHGKRSSTVVCVRERFSAWTLLECEALTDRPHQIRVHLRKTALPVCGDGNYGGRPLLLSRLKNNYRLKGEAEERPLLGTPALHLERVVVPHPVSGELLTITAPLPKDLVVALKYLRRYAGGGAAPSHVDNALDAESE